LACQVSAGKSDDNKISIFYPSALIIFSFFLSFENMLMMHFGVVLVEFNLTGDFVLAQ
jgi:hypothetical protein